MESTYFRNYLREIGYGKGVVNMLPSCIDEFFIFTGKNSLEIGIHDIKSYHQYLKSRPNQRRSGGLSNQMIAHHIYALRTYFAWQLETGAIPINPMNTLQFKKMKAEERVVLSPSEIKSLFQVCETPGQRVLLHLFYSCGLRRSEGEQLDLTDLHFRTGLLYVRSGKNSKRRVVPMSENTKASFEAYLSQERPKHSKSKAFVINNKLNRKMGQSYNRALKRLLASAGLSDEISLHNLRHSIATHLLSRGMSIEYVRDFLGHKNLLATQIYTRITKKL